jgi:uncharacterized protein DUF4154
MFIRLILTFCMAAGFIKGFNSERMDEYQVKAAFLYNFARFVEWPAETFRNPGAPFAICVLGEDPFGRTLDDVVAGKSIAERPVAIRRVSDARSQVLFISSGIVGSTAGKRVLLALASAKQTGVLTVGDSGISRSEDVIIGFIMEDGKVRFRINTAAADRNVLHISAKLLNLAKAGGR